MKEKLSRMLRSGIAMLLVLCMVAGFVPTAVFATGTAKKYVSLGDSMTNGLGLGNGYDSTGREGYNEICTTAYPYLVADKLGWELTQLATSCMRVEDLHYILDVGTENAYLGDSWTQTEMMPRRWAEKDGVKAADRFQNAVKNADVISLAAGNCNFGVYLMDMIVTVIGLGGYGLNYDYCTLENALELLKADAKTKALVKDIYDQLLAYMGDAVSFELAETLANRFAYVVASFVVNYEGALDRIIELNPDVEIVIVGLLNTMSGFELKVTSNGETVELDMAEMLDMLINPMNAYLAGLPAAKQALGGYAEAKLYYAEMDRIETHAKTFKEVYQDESNQIRDRFVKTIVGNGDGVGLVWQMLMGMGKALETITINDVVEYETYVFGADGKNDQVKQIQGLAAYNQDPNRAAKAASVNFYLTFENAILDALESTPNINVDEIVMPGGEFNLMAIIAANLDPALNTTPNTEAAVAANLFAVTEQIYISMQPGYDPDNSMSVLRPDPSIIEKIISDPTTDAERAIKADAIKVATALVTPTAMATDLNSNGLLSALLSLYGRMQLANGMAAHPNHKDHKDMADEIIAAYGNYTVKDETEKNVNIVLNELYNLVQEYGPEVAAQVWAQWESKGYVEMVETSINKLLATLETRYEYYTTEALPAIDASVLELVAQKDALLVELDALKVELAAKKAELEDVISKQEISDIYAPNINIDVELGNNEQTTVPENECVVESATIKGELEAAIRDIEHAIATIEALIADIEADVADMVALAEQIAAAVAELEKHMESIAVAAKDLNAAVLAVAEVLENSNGVVDSVLKSFDAARETVLAASKVLDLAMGVANEMIADIDGMIAKVAADAEALYNKVVADLPAALAQMPEEMVMAIGIALYASQYVDVAAIDLALQAKAAEYGITEETLTEEYITAKIAEIAAEYGVTDETVLAKYNEITGKIDAYITEKYAQIEADTKAQIAALEAEATEKIAALELELEGYKAQLAELAEDAAEEVKAGIQAQIDRVTADIATVNADLEHAVAHLNNAAEMAYQQIVAEAMKIYENVKAAVEAEIAALEEQLKAMISDLEATVEGIKAAVEAAKATIEGILNANIESIEDLMNTLVALGAEEAAKLVESVVDQINAIFKKATSSDLVLHEGFEYVAIGDGSAAAESYVEKLAAALNVEAAAKGFGEISYDNNAKAGNTVAAERANLSDVTGADLITVGFSNVNFLSDALNKTIEGAEVDWANYVGEENVEYVDELLAEVDAKLAEGIEDAAMRAYVMNIAEAYAYSAVEYAVELPALINEINAVNSDALVIIVGMYNPLEDVTIALNETTTLDIGEYVDYLVKGVAVHGIAYSVLTGNAIYVDAPAVETAVTGKTLGLMDLMGLLMSNFAGMYPTEAGHEYIKNQILNALDMTTGLLGDADSNGKITSNDAKLILQYIVKIIGADDLDLSVCDVDGNGKITSNDSKLILQYVVKIITKFPAEA